MEEEWLLPWVQREWPRPFVSTLLILTWTKILVGPWSQQDSQYWDWERHWNKLTEVSGGQWRSRLCCHCCWRCTWCAVGAVVLWTHEGSQHQYYSECPLGTKTTHMQWSSFCTRWISLCSTMFQGDVPQKRSLHSRKHTMRRVVSMCNNGKRTDAHWGYGTKNAPPRTRLIHQPLMIHQNVYNLTQKVNSSFQDVLLTRKLHRCFCVMEISTMTWKERKPSFFIIHSFLHGFGIWWISQSDCSFSYQWEWSANIVEILQKNKRHSTKDKGQTQNTATARFTKVTLFTTRRYRCLLSATKQYTPHKLNKSSRIQL